jgi:hypothetical protein
MEIPGKLNLPSFSSCRFSMNPDFLFLTNDWLDNLIVPEGHIVLDLGGHVGIYITWKWDDRCLNSYPLNYLCSYLLAN